MNRSSSAPVTLDSSRNESELTTGSMRLHCQRRSSRLVGNEPASVSVPLATGRLVAVGDLWIETPTGDTIACQAEVLARWPDGSIRWLLVRFLVPANSDPTQANWTLHWESRKEREAEVTSTMTVAGRAKFPLPNGSLTLQPDRETLFELEYGVGGPNHAPVTWTCQWRCTSEHGAPRPAVVRSVRSATQQSQGEFHVEGVFRGTRLRFVILGRLFPSLGLLSLTTTIHNPSRAQHPGGFWDLGDLGSQLIRDISCHLISKESSKRTIRWTTAPGDVEQATAGGLGIYQESSGGEHWNSANHKNRQGRVPLQQRGYTCTFDGQSIHGSRATPTVTWQSAAGQLRVTCRDFWQLFPAAFEVDARQMRVAALPAEFPDLHEIQGGEQTTREYWLAWSSGADHEANSLAFVHDPLVFHVDELSLVGSQAIPFLPSSKATTRPDAATLLEASLQGPNNWLEKRETIDEYGWRNYGDLWADHESAFYDGPAPVISHYNNQYDALYGFLLQFLRTRDVRWWDLAQPLARHMLDIDLYHTDGDKSTYNGGLFWHTAHYHDAATASHRTMSRQMLGKSKPAGGGGPGAEHNYAAGLALYYWLTGDPRAREGVQSLADWVIHMDDGRQHLFGIVSDQPTGSASVTAEATFHGPGRGAGNSINALLDGWLVSDDQRYLHKLEAIVRRTIHPHDDIDARQLLHAEMRWSYTVYLQALVRVLVMTRSITEWSDFHRYVRACLVHYARWMARHERLYFDARDELEYPTETWSAQDLRKGVVLLMAADFCDDADEATKWRQRGQQILDQAWSQLNAFPTRTFTRPLVLVLQQGYLETFFTNPHEPLGEAHHRGRSPENAANFGAPTSFTSQRAVVRRLLKSPWKLPAAICRQLRWQTYRLLWRRTWAAERLRRWTGR